jgi:hypothetical protein
MLRLQNKQKIFKDAKEKNLFTKANPSQSSDLSEKY